VTASDADGLRATFAEAHRRYTGERAPTISRPLGSPEWIAMLERRLGRPLAPRKPGPKPRVERDTAQQGQPL